MSLNQSRINGTVASTSGDLTFFTTSQQMEKAAHLVNTCCESDQSFSDLKYKLRLFKLDQPTVSGLNEADYPAYVTLNFEPNAEFSTVKRQALPQELLDQVARMECNFAMGVFSDISRAWMTVDSDLFVWNYDNNSDLAFYDGISNTILMITMTKPKPGVLPPIVHYLLCVVTSVDIVLLGVNFLNADGQLTEDFRTGDMNLLPEPLFKCSLDGVIISDAFATVDGHFFLAGRDGCLYEIKYQTSALFGRSCKRINHSKGVMSYLIPSIVAFTLGRDEPLAQIVVDESRNILFTRSNFGSLQIFDVVDNQVSKIGSLSAQEIQHCAARIVQTIDQDHFSKIISIDAIQNSESTILNLVGVTQSGVRLYFSCYNDETPTSPRPQTLKLVHIRFPPGFCPSTSSVRPEKVHKSLIRCETSFMVSTYDEQTDLLWCFSGAHFPFKTDFMETQIQLPIRGRTWVLDEFSPKYNRHFSKNSRFSSSSALKPPLAALQHNETSKSFIVLTPQAYFVIERSRPVDVLRSLLVEFGPDSPNIKSFFYNHKPSQAGAMCVLLACSTAHHERQVADKALRALLLYGGDAKIIAPSMGYTGQRMENNSQQIGQDFNRISSFVTSTPAPTALRGGPNVPYGASFRSNAIENSTFSHNTNNGYHLSVVNQPSGQQIYHQSMVVAGGDLNLSSSIGVGQKTAGGGRLAAGQQYEVRFSDRHNSYYLYFSRIMSVLWQTPVVNDRTIPYMTRKTIDVLYCTFSSDEVASFLEQIHNFVNFMKTTANLPPSVIQYSDDVNSPYRDTAYETVSKNLSNIHSFLIDLSLLFEYGFLDDAQYAEQQSLVSLLFLASKFSEVLGLLKILIDHQMHIIVALLPKDQQEKLRLMTFDRLVIDGQQICSDLVLCLMNQYLSDKATTDAISGRLRQVCPSLFTSDDATSTKANELLISSRIVNDESERRSAVEKAVTMYKKIANQVHLPTVCAQLREAHDYEAIVELCVCAANKLDPANRAMQFYNRSEAEQEADSIQKQIFTNRLNCYKCITDVMTQLLNASSGRHPTIPAQQARVWIDNMIKKVLSDDEDELSHVVVFDWLFEHNLLADLILTMKSRCIEPYLHKCLKNSFHLNTSCTYLDLLWKYYEKEKKFTEAANALLKLAEGKSLTVDLSQRLTYLSRAVLCCKASTDVSPQRAEFLHDLEDKLEVSKIQMSIVENLRRLSQNGETRNALTKLNASLLDVTQLYTNYADEFNFSECKLAILHCAGHNDPTLVEHLWRDIIDSELALRQRDSTQIKARLVADKIRNSIKLYLDSPKYLPINFLIKYLFAKSVDNDFDPNWLTETLTPAGISYYELLSVLDSIFRQWTNTPAKKDRRLQIYILKAISELVTEFTKLKSHYTPKEKSKMKSAFLDCCALYIVELETMPSGSETISLRQNFRDLQTAVENL